jgi:hypothetical protein
VPKNLRPEDGATTHHSFESIRSRLIPKRNWIRDTIVSTYTGVEGTGLMLSWAAHRIRAVPGDKTYRHQTVENDRLGLIAR